jgi:hypothetical protein
MPSCQMHTILRSIPTLCRVEPAPGIKITQEPVAKDQNSPKKRSKDIDRKRLAVLAEAVILQTLEDLWSKTHKKRSLAFFTTEGFHICAEISGMKIADRLRFFRLLRRLEGKTFDSRHAKKVERFIKKEKFGDISPSAQIT